MHIFPYSVRTGTAAGRWKQLPPTIVQERVRRLHKLDEQLSLAYREQLLQRTIRVLLEQPTTDGFIKGRCDHYAEILVRSNQQIGSIIEAKVTQVQSEKTFAEPVLQIL